MNDATEGRDEAMALFEEYRAEWLVQARIVANRLYRQFKRPITVDDVRLACPPPAGCDPRVMGAVFSGWTPVGFANSQRRTCHRRHIRLFEPTGEAEGAS
jgi:hypothetical protein